jgi:hypothetical protein
MGMSDSVSVWGKHSSLLASSITNTTQICFETTCTLYYAGNRCALRTGFLGQCTLAALSCCMEFYSTIPFHGGNSALASCFLTHICIAQRRKARWSDIFFSSALGVGQKQIGINCRFITSSDINTHSLKVYITLLSAFCLQYALYSTYVLSYLPLSLST